MSKPNNNKCNINNRIIVINLRKNYLNNSNDKILVKNIDIKKNNFINKQKVISGIKVIGINIIKNKNYFPNNKSERNNNTHNKNNKNSLSKKRIDKYGNDVERKKYSFIGNYEKEGLLYKKIINLNQFIVIIFMTVIKIFSKTYLLKKIISKQLFFYKK